MTNLGHELVRTLSTATVRVMLLATETSMPKHILGFRLLGQYPRHHRHEVEDAHKHERESHECPVNPTYRFEGRDILSRLPEQSLDDHTGIAAYRGQQTPKCRRKGHGHEEASRRETPGIRPVMGDGNKKGDLLRHSPFNFVGHGAGR